MILSIMDDLNHQLARKIRSLRGDRTLQVFARRLGLDVSSVSRIERGGQNVTLATLQKLCNRLKCGIAELFDLQELESKKGKEKDSR